jgi:antitoxin ParD1/3/4
MTLIGAMSPALLILNGMATITKRQPGVFMTISVPDSAKAFIEEQASKGGYASAEEYLVALLERERNRALREEIEQKLLEAVNSPSSPMAREDWEEIRREGRRLIEQRKGR